VNRNFVHSALFRLFAPPLFGAIGYLLIILINNTVEDAEKFFSRQEVYVCIGLTYIAFETMRLAIRRLEKYSVAIPIQKRLLLQIISAVIPSLIIVSLAISYYYSYFIGFSIGRSEFKVFVLVFAMTNLLYTLLYYSHYYLMKENKERLLEEKKMREDLEADFSSFKNEVNPDLLYESLENLILTLHDDVEKAEEQVDQLASIYRYGLVNRQKELTSLEEELQAVSNLLALQNIKYNQAISLVNDVENPDSVYLIPGSLMITVNAVIRNTLISDRSPLQFHVYREDKDYVVLQHRINDRLLQHEGSLQVFHRLQRSYTFFCEKPFVQVKADLENYIKFPLLYVAAENPIEMV